MATRRQPDSEIIGFRKVYGAGMVQASEILPVEASDSERLQINVVFTNMQGTQAALKRAVDLAVDLEAETRIIVPHVVPFPLPLDEPTVPVEFTCEQIRHLAGAVGADPYVDFYLCRDRIDLLLKVLPRRSIVVLGARKRWFPTQADRLMRILGKHSWEVVLARY